MVAAPSVQLNDIALGEATPQEAWAAIHALATEEPTDLGRRLYGALRAFTMHQLTGRRGRELDIWVDLMRSAAGMARETGDPSSCERLLALSELTADWRRQREANSPAEVLKRPHARRVLQALNNKDGVLTRAALLDTCAIGTANLSRILGYLETAGLISRDIRGRTRDISLTADGRAALAIGEPRSDQPGRAPRIFPIKKIRNDFFHSESGQSANLCVGVIRDGHLYGDTAVVVLGKNSQAYAHPRRRARLSPCAG